MQLLITVMRSSWATGLVSLFLGGVSGGANLALIALIHRSLLPGAVDSPRMPWLFGGACLLVLTAQWTAKCVLVRLSQATAAKLQYELCLKILTTPLAKIESVGSHRLLATLIHDVRAITAALAQFPNVCAQTMVLVFGLIYLGMLSVPLALGTLLMATVGVGTYLACLSWANKHIRGVRKGEESVIKHLRDMIHGIKELKGNKDRCHEFTYDVLLPADTSMRKRVIKALSIESFAHSWGRMYLFVGIGLVLFLWPRLTSVSIETLTGYTLTILYLTFPLDGILGWLPAMNRAGIAFKKIEKLGLQFNNPEPEPSATAKPNFSSLELRQVAYSYAGKNSDGFRLGPISFSLTAGEVLFIAGGNGSGKTTLAKILNGLYQPRSGALLWDGKRVTHETLPNYRQLFSTVFVDAHVFDRLLGVEPNPAKLHRWAKMLGIENKIDFDTGKLMVNKLSRGQHKRMALLIAALEDRPVFLFDEWAAEQDPNFKSVFYNNILPDLRKAGKTVVAITHDDRYFSAADRVLKVVDGQLVEADNHRQIAA